MRSVHLFITCFLLWSFSLPLCSIDSLDRTNVAQFCIGKCALGYQLFALGLIDSVHLAGGGATAAPTSDQSSGSGSSSAAATSASSEIVNILLDLYEGMGDELSQQYGGSAMHRSIKTARSSDGKNTLTLAQHSSSSQPKEVIVSIKRHIQNSFQDTGKQDAINLFLGYFIPPLHTLPSHAGDRDTDSSSEDVAAFLSKHLSHSSASSTASGSAAANPPVHIWDLTSDYYLHNPKHITTLDRMLELEAKRQHEAEMFEGKESATTTSNESVEESSSAALTVSSSSSFSSSTSSDLRPRGGILLELGHRLYRPTPIPWWRAAIRTFDRTIDGYLPDWLMTFPKGEGRDVIPPTTSTNRMTGEEREKEIIQETNFVTPSNPTTAKVEVIENETDATAITSESTSSSSSLSIVPPSPSFSPSASTITSTSRARPRYQSAYYANSYPDTSLTSFDELLMTDVYKVHSVRILGGGTITPTPKGYSSLIPRFLARRNKAEDEEMDDENEDEGLTPRSATASANDTLKHPSIGFDGVAQSVSPLNPHAHLTPTPQAWLQPNERSSSSSSPSSHGFGILGGGSSMHVDGESGGLVSISEDGTHTNLSSDHDSFLPSMVALAGGVGSMSGSANHFSAPSFNTSLQTEEQRRHEATLSMTRHYVHGANQRLGPDGEYTTPTAVLPSASDRKLYHYLDHYANIRVEHNLIVEPVPSNSSLNPSLPVRPLSPTVPNLNIHTPLLIPSPTPGPLTPTAPSSPPMTSSMSSSHSTNLRLTPVTPTLDHMPTGGILTPDIPLSPSSTRHQQQALWSTVLGPPPSPFLGHRQQSHSHSHSQSQSHPNQQFGSSSSSFPSGSSSSSSFFHSHIPPPLPRKVRRPDGSHSLIFSHAPPTSSITIRNSKRAIVYSAYLRRGEFDSHFLSTSIEMDRLAGAAAPIQVELEHDTTNEEIYKRYVNVAC